MGDIGERIRHQASLDKVMSADAAAALFRDGMLVATSPRVRFQGQRLVLLLISCVAFIHFIPRDLLPLG